MKVLSFLSTLFMFYETKEKRKKKSISGRWKGNAFSLIFTSQIFLFIISIYRKKSLKWWIPEWNEFFFFSSFCLWKLVCLLRGIPFDGHFVYIQRCFCLKSFRLKIKEMKILEVFHFVVERWMNLTLRHYNFWNSFWSLL